jgi:hypothetical protein
LDLLANTSSHTRITDRASAYAWITSDDIKAWSFHWVCDHLNVDARTARNNILNIDNSKHYRQGHIQNRSVVSMILDDVPSTGNSDYCYFEDFYDEEMLPAFTTTEAERMAFKTKKTN